MLRIGDKVKIIDKHFDDGNNRNYIGRECLIYKLYGENYQIGGYRGNLWELRTSDKGEQTYAFEVDLKVITNNTNMNLKDKFTLAFKGEPEKSFRKTGITNGDDFLTEDGQQVFLGWLLKKHGEEFKKEVVDDLLKEQEEKK